MTYQVSCLTVRGRLVDIFTSLEDAEDWAERLKKLGATPGYFAGGIKIVEVA